MAMSSVRVVIHPSAIKELEKSSEAQAEVERRAAAIAEACNAESSWGGYESGPVPEAETAEANVWSIGANDDDERRQRIVRNLDAG